MIKPVCLLLSSSLFIASCSKGQTDWRGVERSETLLSVSATGQTETTPDMASFSAGVENFAASAERASAQNSEKMEKVVEALLELGIAEKDIRTQSISMNRIDYGPRKGQYQANNQLSVRVRDIDKASEAIGAATQAGANVLSGPTLSQSDPEASRLSAYGNAYKAARARAEAYAEAAGMKIARVMVIRDGGASATPPPYPVPPPIVRPEEAVPVSAPPVRAGAQIEQVAVSVDFALEPK